VLDGVCSVAGEEIRQEAWGLDVMLTASQKAVGMPPGLALLVVSAAALAEWRSRKTPVANYYADWAKWLPIMESYEKRVPAYFGTPAIDHVVALDVSLGQILAEGLDARFARHRRFGAACRAAMRALGFGQIPTSDDHAANTMTAPRYPSGVTGAAFLPAVRSAGAILGGGLHPEIRNVHFRIGHMGATTAGDVLATVSAIETGLSVCGHRCVTGSGVAAAYETLLSCVGRGRTQ
jgi:alanine-glyoxylate transaminase/serine-glyoxylate transaminase/serine-pyruvate transaminase